MSVVLILGDPHIGKGATLGKVGIGSNLNSRIIDQINLLDWTLDQAEQHGVDDIIITGDVFEDTKPHPSLIAIFIGWLKRCHAHNIAVHIILGNHDMIRSGVVFTSSLDIISEADLDNVFVYKNINTIFKGTTAITIMPFRDRKSFSVSSNSEALSLLKDSLVYELTGIPLTYKKIVIGHLAIEGSIPIGDEIDDVTNELFCPTEMFNGYDCVWMGHVHKPQVMKKNPYISHIGSMDISNFGETDHVKNIVIFDCNSIDTEFTEIPIPTRSLKKISVCVPKDTKDPTKYVLSEIKKQENKLDESIVKVEVSYASPETKSIDKGSIEKFLLNKGVFNVAGISESKKVTVIKKDPSNIIDTKMDLNSALKAYANKYIEEKTRAAFMSLALEIISTYKSGSKE